MVGLRRHDVVATRLEPANAEEELLDYWLHNPLIFKYMTAPKVGYKGDTTEEDVRELAKHVPIFYLSPCY